MAATIRKLRASRGWDQKDLAKNLGCSIGAVSFWERAINEPTAPFAAALARLAGISVEELLGRKTPPEAVLVPQPIRLDLIDQALSLLREAHAVLTRVRGG